MNATNCEKRIIKWLFWWCRRYCVCAVSFPLREASYVLFIRKSSPGNATRKTFPDALFYQFTCSCMQNNEKNESTDIKILYFMNSGFTCTYHSLIHVHVTRLYMYMSLTYTFTHHSLIHVHINHLYMYI